MAVVPVGVASVLPVYIERAHGAIVVDVDGNQFIDLGAGIGVTTIGHTDDAVVAAASAQLDDVTHTLFTITPYEAYVRVAELLAEHTPGDYAKKTVLVNSGAEAVENAVKIARKHTRRPGVAVLEHAYHGRTNLTMAMNFKAAPYGTGFGPFAGDVYRAPNSYPFHDGLSGAEAAARTIGYLEKTVGASDLACLVVEPIQGEGGFQVPADGYLPALQEWCTANGIVFIADEIQSGMARTGALLRERALRSRSRPGAERQGNRGRPAPRRRSPAARRSWMPHTRADSAERSAATPSRPQRRSRSSSRSRRTTSSARRDASSDVLTRGLRELQDKYPVIGEVRGIGAMIAIELVEPGTKKPNAAAVSAIAAFAAQKGVIVLTAGTYGNVLRFLPSLAISDALLTEALGVIDEALSAL